MKKLLLNYKYLAFLISKDKKKKILILFFLLSIATVLEMASIGVLLPFLGFIIQSKSTHPILQDLIKFLGNPDKTTIIVYFLIFLIFVYLVKTIYLSFLSWYQSNFSASLVKDLSNELFIGYINQPYDFYLNRNTSELTIIIQNELNQFSIVVQAAITLFTELTIVIAILLTFLIIEPIGSLTVSILLLFFVLLFNKFTHDKIISWGEMRQFYSGNINKIIFETFGGIKDLKILCRQSFFKNSYISNNLKFSEYQAKYSTLSVIPRFYLEFISVVGISVLIFVMIISGKSIDQLVPTLAVFATASFRAIPSLNRVMGSIQSIKYGNAVIKLLYKEFIEIRTNKNSFINSNDELLFNKNINFKNLSFSYPLSKKIVISNVNLSISKGETIGIVGASGSGKSTFIDLLLGLLKPTTGEICIDNLNINRNLDTWQKFIGYVPQTIFLSDDTIIKNVAFGISDNEIDINKVKKALDLAQILDHFESLPEGLSTFVGERGIRISGGQRQRIGIARALYNNPLILVLDEATSSLDSKTELEVMKSINLLKGVKTIIIAAHRLSTLEKCDRIIEVKNGTIYTQMLN
jgi:ABC-type multidrug transport system fused ATPase/permease subunit